MKPIITTRSLIASGTVGSKNYNLANDDSDTDVRYYVCPTFEDLYSGTKVSRCMETDDYSLTEYDIRLLPDHLAKMNPNFLEFLVSVDLKTLIFLPTPEEVIFNHPQYFCDAVCGSFRQFKGMWEKTKNFKKASHAFRMGDLLYSLSLGHSFAESIRYEGSAQEAMMSIKNGKISEEAINNTFRSIEQDFSRLVTIITNMAKSSDWQEKLVDRIQLYILAGISY